MTRVNIKQLRPQMRKLADKVCHHGERICVERNGEPAFVMVSYEDVKTLEALEDKLDLKAIEEAIKQGEFTDWDEIVKKLKL